MSTSISWKGDREDWLQLADRLVTAPVSRLNASATSMSLDGPGSTHGAQIDEMEAVSRVFMLACFRACAEGLENPADLPPLLLRRVLNGLSGDPHRGGWPSAVHGNSNVVVEAASVALGLWLTRVSVWDCIDRSTRRSAVNWLRSAVRTDVGNNNWVLFPAVTASFLLAVGEGEDWMESIPERSLRRIEQWRVGGGWYADGGLGRAFDYYNSWALHFYPSVMAYLAQDPQRIANARSTLSEFLSTFPALFSRTGSHVYFGRSLTYRFGASTALSLGALLNADAISPPFARTLASANLDYFVRGGATAVEDPLPLGWLKRQPALAQGYSGPLASYWASKAFVNLLIPPQDPYWSEPCTDQLPDTGVTQLGDTGLLVSRSQGGRIVRLSNHGSWHSQILKPAASVDDPLYARLGYSNVTAPVGTDDERCYGLYFRGTFGISSRSIVRPRGHSDNWAASESIVRTANPLRLRGRLAHARLGRFLIRSFPVGPARNHRHSIRQLTLMEEGWSVECGIVNYPPAKSKEAVFAGWALGCDSANYEVGRNRVAIHNGKLFSVLIALYGFTTSKVAELSAPNPFGDDQIVPVVSGPADDTTLYIAATYLGEEIPPREPSIRIVDETIVVYWPSGERQQVRMGRSVPQRWHCGDGPWQPDVYAVAPYAADDPTRTSSKNS